MKIFILGSEGFIGKHCTLFFTKQGHKVIGGDLLTLKPAYEYHQLDSTNPDYGAILGNSQFDLCINAGGNGSVPKSVAQPIVDFEANVYENFRLLEQIRLTQHSCKYIYFSSAAVYGNPVLPVKESNEINPVSPYGWHKYQSELICKEYHVLYNIPIVILRPFSVYGPGLRKQIIWDLYNKFHQQQLVEVFGNGNESRDFIYILDLLRALDVIIKRSDSGFEVFNIAAGKEIFVCQIVEFISAYLNRPKESYFFNGMLREGDPKNWVADTSKLTELGFSTEYSFQQGLTATLNWLKSAL